MRPLVTELLLPWAEAFAFTQLVEIPIYRHALGGRFWVAFGASAITHPVVWFVFPWVFYRWVPIADPVRLYWASVVAAEAFAVATEALWLGKWGLKRALPWSLLANASSLGLGLASRALFGHP